MDPLPIPTRAASRHHLLLTLTFSLLASTTLPFTASAQAQAQSQERPADVSREERGGRGPGGRGERGERGGDFARLSPLMVALDTNNDGVIDAAEIANAPVALKKLDKNGDGKLSEDELRPNFGRGRGPNSLNPDEFVTRLMQFDKNGDGKLAKDELPERMQALLERGDADKDGLLNKDELRKLAEQQAQQAGRRGPGGAGGEGGERRSTGEGRP